MIKNFHGTIVSTVTICSTKEATNETRKKILKILHEIEALKYEPEVEVGTSSKMF